MTNAYIIDAVRSPRGRGQRTTTAQTGQLRVALGREADSSGGVGALKSSSYSLLVCLLLNIQITEFIYVANCYL